MQNETSSQALPARLRTVLHIGAVLGLLIGFLHAAFGSAASASVALSAGILLLLLSEADKFEVLKGFGFEAKMRQLNNTMTEAQQIVGQLRALALATARNIVALVSNTDGYVETYSRKTAWNMVESVRKNLESLEIPKAEIDEVLEPFHQLVTQWVLGSFQHQLEVAKLLLTGEPSVEGDATVAHQDLVWLSKTSTSPEEWRRAARGFATIKNTLPQERDPVIQEMHELADDLEHWQTKRKLRRPATYFGCAT